MRNIRRRTFLKLAGMTVGANSLVSKALSQQVISKQGTGPGSPEIESGLTAELLMMPRMQAVFSGRRLRLFNGRGSVSVRDWTVTGLQAPDFLPIALRNYTFQLAWKIRQGDVLIQDVVGDQHETLVITGQGASPLGDNFSPRLPLVVLLQEETWRPNLYHRTGTFHKLIQGQWISFGLETWLSVSAESDEAYLHLKIHNRESTPLSMTVLPVQKLVDYTLRSAQSKDAANPAVAQSGGYTLAGEKYRITAVSDLPAHNAEGWELEIPGHGEASARFALVFQSTKATPPNLHAPDLAARMSVADRAVRERLEWASKKLPRISTGKKQLDDLYYRSILSVLDSRWDRKNMVTRPFYAVGTWPFTIAWDSSYASELLSMLDPAGLRRALHEYIRAGLLTNSYVPWNGKAGHYWYVQTPFAAMRILMDYLRQTGDTGILNDRVGSRTVFEEMKHVGEGLHSRFARPDGLLDFGADAQRFLELRTDGYQHVVAADNGLALAYFRQVAAWCRSRNDSDADRFEGWADRIQTSMRVKLWDQQAGWFANLYPDGSRHLVWSYHLYDLMGSDALTVKQEREIVSHIKEGEFLGPFGMYAIAKQDTVHWDLMDSDWGGGGQYTGMPLRIAESLYRAGYAQLGWDVLSRCMKWTERYPYIPQDVFTDQILDLEDEDMPLEIASGSAAQAVLFGIFGLRPAIDGTLTISPSYHDALGESTMTGYTFHNHTYDLVLTESRYRVYRDGKLAAENPYSKATVFPRG